MLVSGLHISYGIFNNSSSTKYHLSIIISSWYVGVILASIAAHFFVDKCEKKMFYVSYFMLFKNFISKF